MITIASIIAAVAKAYDFKPHDLISQRRARLLAEARHIAMWLAAEYTDHSLPTIGRAFGGRDHTTVMHALRRVEQLRVGDPTLRVFIDDLAAEIAARHRDPDGTRRGPSASPEGDHSTRRLLLAMASLLVASASVQRLSAGSSPPQALAHLSRQLALCDALLRKVERHFS